MRVALNDDHLKEPTVFNDQGENLEKKVLT